MRAVVLRDGGLSVEERPDPEPGADDLLVRVESAGLNGADLSQRAGHYPPPPGAPQDIAGLEMAGTVVATGNRVLRFSPGDRVMGIVAGGGQAELCLLHERIAMPVPPSLPMAQAGGFPEVFTTAHDAIFTQCGLRAGERILVTGGAGGVGLAAVQMAVQAGASVVASVRHPEFHDAVAAYGASVRPPGEEAADGPYDVILELVGAPNLPADLGALATGGRIVVIGTGAGADASLDLRQLMRKRALVRASTLRARPLEEKAITARLIERHVLPHVAAGRITVPVAAAFPLAEAAAAYDRFTHGKLGKIIIDTTA